MIGMDLEDIIPDEAPKVQETATEAPVAEPEVAATVSEDLGPGVAWTAQATATGAKAAEPEFDTTVQPAPPAPPPEPWVSRMRRETNVI